MDGAVPALDRTAKMYVGGKQARPDGGYSRAVWSGKGKLLGHVGIGNRKDIRNAVEAAQAAVAWSRTTGHARAQILYYIAENLEARADEFAGRIADLTGATSRRRAQRSPSPSAACSPTAPGRTSTTAPPSRCRSGAWRWP